MSTTFSRRVSVGFEAETSLGVYSFYARVTPGSASARKMLYRLRQWKLLHFIRGTAADVFYCQNYIDYVEQVLEEAEASNWLADAAAEMDVTCCDICGNKGAVRPDGLCIYCGY